MKNYSDMFANIENRFKSMDKDEITETALSSMGELLEAFDSMEDQFKFGLIVTGAKLGVAGDGILNRQEKELIDEVFGDIWNRPIEEVYDFICADITESDYKLVETIAKLNNPVGMYFLYYVLSFAYIDGEIEDDIANKLDKLFEMYLMVDFIQNGGGGDSEPEVQLTGLEEELVNWYEAGAKACDIDEIHKHFPTRSKEEIQSALDSLIEKEIVYAADTVVGRWYGLI